MRTSASKKPFRTALLAVGVVLVCLTRASPRPGFKPGTDNWGVQGCISSLFTRHQPKCRFQDLGTSRRWVVTLV